MKILRVRRGFTTNSSASSEWVPPPWQQNLQGAREGTGATAPAGAPTTAGTQAGTPASGAAPPAALSGNTLTLGVLLAVVALLFTAERLVRRVLRRRQAEDAEDE